MEAKPAPNSEFGAGLEEQKIDREAALPNHIVYDLVCDTMWYKPKSIQKDRCVNTQRSFCGAPDWIRTSGLPGRSRTLYPTELRTHIYENRPKTGFSYSVVSGQIVVRLLQNRRTRCRKMALLCGFSAAPNCLSELSENCDAQANSMIQRRKLCSVHNFRRCLWWL